MGRACARAAGSTKLGPLARPPEDPWRALWVTRWDYRTPDDVRDVVRHAAGAGFDRLLFQVRGNAAAFYTSRLEPRAEELEGTSFDPLAVALAEAHGRGLELHAWLNVVPSWRGLTPPRDPRHVYHARPDWHWYDQHGRRAPLVRGFYVSLNPCLPEVRAYLADVVRELAGGYALDGLHLDYLRLPNEPPVVARGSGIDYPRDERTLALFAAQSGCGPDADPTAWDEWRSAQVTELVAAIRRAAREARPGAVLSAAVGPLPELALRHHQDVGRWGAQGLLDALVPMNYATGPAAYDACLRGWEGCRLRVVPGVRADLGEPAERVRQLEAAWSRRGHVCVFAYSSLWDSCNTEIAGQSRAERAARAALRARYLPALRALTPRGP